METHIIIDNLHNTIEYSVEKVDQPSPKQGYYPHLVLQYIQVLQ